MKKLRLLVGSLIFAGSVLVLPQPAHADCYDQCWYWYMFNYGMCTQYWTTPQDQLACEKENNQDYRRCTQACSGGPV